MSGAASAAPVFLLERDDYGAHLTPSPKHQLRLLAEVAVFKLYEAHLDDDSKDRHSLDEIKKMFTSPVSKRLLQSSIEYMRRGRSPSLITRSGTAGSYYYKISNDGILFAEQQLKSKNSLISYYAEYGDERLDDVAGFNAIFQIDDDETILSAWTRLDLDKSRDEFGEFVRQLDDCINAVKTSNELASLYPEERENILVSLLKTAAPN